MSLRVEVWRLYITRLCQKGMWVCEKNPFFSSWIQLHTIFLCAIIFFCSICSSLSCCMFSYFIYHMVHYAFVKDNFRRRLKVCFKSNQFFFSIYSDHSFSRLSVWEWNTSFCPFSIIFSFFLIMHHNLMFDILLIFSNESNFKLKFLNDRWISNFSSFFMNCKRSFTKESTYWCNSLFVISTL